MAGGNDFGDLNTCVQVVAALAVLQWEAFLECGQEKCNMEGCPHQKKGKHDGQNQPAKTVAPSSAPQRFSYPHRAAKDKYTQGKEKHQDVHL